MRDSEGLFVISVAARLLDMHPQTLRKYERVGFVIPSRTSGKIRLYSREDIARLEQVKYLVNERDLNLAGVEMALDVTEQLKKIANRLRKSKRSDYDEIADALDNVLMRLGADPTAEKDRR
ncbi:MAG TPA: MerR family transcriptional regulator [Thermomicrobiales bacterium]|nr:MerR family transcriptional regulator [Thermomicrobiales bacterium]